MWSEKEDTEIRHDKTWKYYLPSFFHPFESVGIHPRIQECKEDGIQE